MATIERRLEELEKHSPEAGKDPVRFIRFVGMGKDHLPIVRMQCGSLEVHRADDESDEAFEARVEREVLAAFPGRHGPHMIFSYYE